MSLIQEALKRQLQEQGAGDLKAGAPPPQRPTPGTTRHTSSPTTPPLPASPSPPVETEEELPPWAGGRKALASAQKKKQIVLLVILLVIVVGVVGFVTLPMLQKGGVLPQRHATRQEDPTVNASPGTSEAPPAPRMPGRPRIPAPAGNPPLSTLSPSPKPTSGMTTAAESKTVLIWPNVVVTGIAGQGSKGSAIINGHIVPVGESIHDITVVSIGVQGVLLQYQGETQFVRVGSSTQ